MKKISLTQAQIDFLVRSLNIDIESMDYFGCPEEKTIKEILEVLKNA